MTQIERTYEFDLYEKLASSKNSQTAFIGHVIKYIDKINVSILASEKFENIICLNEWLRANLEKLQGVINDFIDLTECPEKIERVNKICSEKCSRVLEIQDVTEHYISKNKNSETLAFKILLQNISNSDKIKSSKSKRKTSSSFSPASR